MRRELTQEEKSLALLARIDFGQEAKKAKTEDGTKDKEEEAVQVWPWQGLVEHLNQAHQELIVILDLISHVRPFQFFTSFLHNLDWIIQKLCCPKVYPIRQMLISRLLLCRWRRVRQ